MANGYEGELDSIEVASEARGSHWVSWVPRREDAKPLHATVLIGATREEAEQNARRWAARLGQAGRVG